MKFGIACAFLVAKASSILLVEATPPRSNDKRKDETDEGSRHNGKNFVSHHEHSSEGKGNRIRQLLREQAGEHQSSQTPNDDESIHKERTTTSTTNRKSGRLMNLPKSKEQTKRKLQATTSCSAPKDNPCQDGQVPVCTKHAKSSTSTDYHYHSDCVDESKVAPSVSVGANLGNERFFENCGCCPPLEESSNKSTKVAPSLLEYCANDSDNVGNCGPSLPDPPCFTGTNQQILDWCGNLPLDQRCCVDPFFPEGGTSTDFCNFPGVQTVCARSCRGRRACTGWSSGAQDRTISIGIGACNGYNESCFSVGANAGVVNVEIKDNACSGSYSCKKLGGNSGRNIVIYESACRDSRACYLSGYASAYIRIKASSCVGKNACWGISPAGGSPLVVGEGSCTCPPQLLQQGYCCAYAGGRSGFVTELEIADDTCNGGGYPCNNCGYYFNGAMDLKCNEQCNGDNFYPDTTVCLTL